MDQPASEPSSDISAPLPAGASSTGLLTVNLDAVVANWRKLESRSVPAECSAVVKANAYGCGLEQVTRALVGAGCKTFFVATLEEARRARSVARQATIYVLDGFFAGTGDLFVKLDCRPVIGDLSELAEWDAFRLGTGHGGGAALHIDTGMNRLGISVAEAQALSTRTANAKHGIELVMSHLACAEDLHNPLNARQLAAFRDAARVFAGVSSSLSNSSGIFLGPQYQFDLVRPGAALYGINPTPEADNPMQPVINLKARVVQVRYAEKGESVGYGATWTARRRTRLAIVSAGYADGYFRAAGGADGVRAAEALVGTTRCPLAGRISMDLMAIDATDVPTPVRRGQMVTLIGDGITVDDLSRHFSTIGYEVLTSLGNRYARNYLSGI